MPEIYSEFEREEDRPSLEGAQLADYEGLAEEYGEWLKGEELPGDFSDRLGELDKDTPITGVLHSIREVLADYGNKKPVAAASFEESRFTSASEVIQRNIHSCGALARVYGSSLRHLGVPVQYVHGRMSTIDEPDHRHGWINVLNSQDRRWVSVDPTAKYFELSPDADEIKIYHDWDELKEDYEKGEY